MEIKCSVRVVYYIYKAKRVFVVKSIYQVECLRNWIIVQEKESRWWKETVKTKTVPKQTSSA